MIKKILFLALSIFLIWQSDSLLLTVPHLELNSFWINLLIAALINLYVTGIFAFAGFGFPTQKLLPENYYRIKKPRGLKQMHRSLHVEMFRKFLLATFWKSPKQRAKHFDGTQSGIDNLETQSRKSEFGHLIPFILLLLISIYWFVDGRVLLSVLTLLINIIFNFYPVLLQRHHRMRIAVLRKIQNRKKR